jgi:hypothetical protein
VADRRLRDILPLLERQELAFNNYPRPGSVIYFASSFYFDVNLDEADGKVTAFCWYAPGELREILAPILDEVPPATSVVPFGKVPGRVVSDVAAAEAIARQLEAELAGGMRWIRGTWWTKPFLMRGRDGWLAIEVEKRRLRDMRRWDPPRVRTDLTRVVLEDRNARAQPIDSKLRSRVLELESTVGEQLNQLLDPARGWEVRDEDSRVIYVRHGDEYVGVNQHQGNVYELFWASRIRVQNEMLEAAAAGKRGGVKAVESALRDQLSEKADRSRYMDMMRAGKLKVGAVPYQTDSEWWLYFKRGKFWNHSSMDGKDYEVSEREAAAILRDHAYTYVSFENQED